GANFARMGVKPVETAIGVSTPDAVRPALAAWQGAVDEVVLRAITAKDTVEENLALIRAAKPSKLGEHGHGEPAPATAGESRDARRGAASHVDNVPFDANLVDGDVLRDRPAQEASGAHVEAGEVQGALDDVAVQPSAR